jgi:hypothetical protein
MAIGRLCWVLVGAETQSLDMLEEGLAREVANRVQKLRKEGGIHPTDMVRRWGGGRRAGRNLLVAMWAEG